MRRRLCEDIGVDLEARGTAVIDHVDHVVSEGYGHTSVLADGFTSSDAILGGFMSKGTVVLGARDTAFSAAPGRAGAEAPALAGGHAALVTAIQARSGARIVISGSMDLFSNAFFSAKPVTSQKERQATSGPTNTPEHSAHGPFTSSPLTVFM
ncbi:hypothetical protein CVIRNUC_007477 [Coccomyxa viridis]|uniref:Dolichyl-diphosphooligosaccharide--protein glycosyltransferase 48 kDa subunit n=1 Tax=Coccomyxa viridis TaxID=1274662 RepID=A0AAV1IEG6_9CHLO|nr:hypothetical protein CVIRNUC_007477 [Coccomyxa viridis]